MKASNLT